jgi:dihydrofolate reductase
MPRLVVFNQVTVDGYFAGANGDISWAHKDSEDAEWNEFVAGNASGGGRLLFGRVTYDLMASYWSTPLAARKDTEVNGSFTPSSLFSTTFAPPRAARVRRRRRR